MKLFLVIMMILGWSSCSKKKTTKKTKTNEFLDSIGVFELEDEPFKVSQNQIQGIFLGYGMKTYESSERSTSY